MDDFALDKELSSIEAIDALSAAVSNGAHEPFEYC